MKSYNNSWVYHGEDIEYSSDASNYDCDNHDEFDDEVHETMEMIHDSNTVAIGDEGLGETFTSQTPREVDFE